MMNGNFMGNLGGPLSLGSFDVFGGNLAGPFQKGADLAITSGEGFINILDLVSDLQIADDSSGELNDLVKNELEGIGFEEALRQGADLGLGAGGSSFLLSSLTAKQQAPVETLNPELSKLVNVVSAQTQEGPEFLLKSDLSLKDVNHPEKRLTSEALQAWAAPIAAGELSEVVVREQPKLAAEKLLSFQKEVPLLSQELLSPSGSAREEAPKVALLSGMVANKTSQATAFEKDVLAESQEVKTLSRDTKQSASVVATSETKDREFSLGSEQRRNSVERKVIDLSASMKASEFLMRGLSNREETSLGAAGSSVLEMPGELLQPGDQRVSPAAMSFVANKVDELKANGGGQLTIKLNPVELGEVQIDVRRTSTGEMSVLLTASKSETQKLFAESSVELQEKLSDRGAKLEIAGASQGRELAQSSKVAEPNGVKVVERSQDFLLGRDMRTASLGDVKAALSQMDSKPIHDLGRMGSSASMRSEMVSGVDGMSAGGERLQDSDGFTSHSKREDARQRWKEQFEQRESA